ncbi:TonB-dependent siderophore receptor [Nostoc sp. KVJ3]|uniref:TonB-dependent siderophore receptor n=1 Tax=Nostoc sp. KVJ3 TaxID=457945 RepID=UPI002239102C|nr:TonB-dependent siderophore receptor [Nostoc sp. KVJ3]MCW5312702.1 TonB-dependent siderophore receptor [Nostoc sp. KVJ3]
MKLKKLLPYLLLTSSLNVLIATTARSEEVGIGVSEHPKSTPTDANSNQSFTVEPIKEIQRISELVHPAKSAEILRQAPQLSQGDATKIVPVSSVKANPTAKGVEVILQTSLGEKLQLVNRSSGNNFITDIPNAQLRLANGDAFTFRSERPVAGINEITVTNFDANTIRVTVIGDASVPAVELFDSPDEGLIFSVASTASSTSQGQQTQTPQKPEPRQTEPNQPSAPSNEPIEIVVTGEQDGYSAPEASTGTRTDTPLRDIPQSIQVIPQQVIKDQGITRISDAVRNVSGAAIQSGYGNLIGDVNLRGFTSNVLRDGFITAPFFTDGANIDRVEVLKGPASVLYGQAAPGGIVNYITKQPLNEPYYSAEFTVGSYDFYKPTLDLSGPLTGDKRLLYRLNISNEDSRSYRDFIDNRIFFISPAFTYKISDATTLNFAYEYLDAKLGFDRGFSPFPAFSNLPRNRNLGDTNDYQIIQVHRFNVTLDQQLSDNLRLRSGFTGRFEYLDGAYANFYSDVDADGRTLDRSLGGGVSYNDSLTLQTDLIGKFKTGSIAHQLLFGFELNRATSRNIGISLTNDEFPSIDIFNPINSSLPPYVLDTAGPASVQNTEGIYLQDQVTLLPNLKLLLGGRYDFINNNAVSTVFYDEAFSPRVGIVYQPIEPISLYASYSKSFEPNDAQRVNGSFIDPSHSTQYEVGVKAELFDKRLSATLAAYDITKTNIATVDPQNPNYSIPVGEVKSRGIELDIAGQISPGWKVIASGYLNDAYVSEDTDSTIIGQRFANAPYHGASLWTTYEIQRGDLQGLQFGAGLFFVGSRIANQSDDPYTLPSYVRTDASISYKRDRWRAALNFKNIFNTNYSETNGYLIFPQAPFTLQGTISVSF